MIAARHAAIGIAVATLAGAFAGCEREARPFQGRTVAMAASGVPPAGTRNPYSGNAWGVGEGKRLFSAYNCVGCHSNGGGGMGPALMDERWIYGSEDDQVYETIARGRPNGMPAFGSRIPQDQIWMLVGYVRSLSGRLPMDVLPSRSDHLVPGPAENTRPARMPGPERRP
jgi:cytochrome c oxidase cbb3-type subunit 3